MPVKLLPLHLGTRLLAQLQHMACCLASLQTRSTLDRPYPARDTWKASQYGVPAVFVLPEAAQALTAGAPWPAACNSARHDARGELARDAVKPVVHVQVWQWLWSQVAPR